MAGGIRVRLKTTSFDMLSRQRQLPRPDDTGEGFYATACALLDQFDQFDQFDHPGPFRLVGMAAYDLDWRRRPRQADLLEDRRSRNLLETAIDDLIDRFGNGVVVRAKDLGDRDTVHDAGVNLDFLDYRDGQRVSAPG